MNLNRQQKNDLDLELDLHTLDMGEDYFLLKAAIKGSLFRQAREAARLIEGQIRYQIKI